MYRHTMMKKDRDEYVPNPHRIFGEMTITARTGEAKKIIEIIRDHMEYLTGHEFGLLYISHIEDIESEDKEVTIAKARIRGYYSPRIEVRNDIDRKEREEVYWENFWDMYDFQYAENFDYLDLNDFDMKLEFRTFNDFYYYQRIPKIKIEYKRVGVTLYDYEYKFFKQGVEGSHFTDTLAEIEQYFYIDNMRCKIMYDIGVIAYVDFNEKSKFYFTRESWEEYKNVNFKDIKSFHPDIAKYGSRVWKN